MLSGKLGCIITFPADRSTAHSLRAALTILMREAALSVALGVSVGKKMTKKHKFGVKKYFQTNFNKKTFFWFQNFGFLSFEILVFCVV